MKALLALEAQKREQMRVEMLKYNQDLFEKVSPR